MEERLEQKFWGLTQVADFEYYLGKFSLKALLLYW